MRILVAVEAVDFRKGIDGLARVCRERLEADPMGGAVFVFRNRRATAIKILVFDGQGYWICQKRLSSGRFRWWPRADAARLRTLDAHQLQMLLWNGDPEETPAGPMWKRISPSQ